MHEQAGDDERHTEHHGSEDVRHGQAGCLGDEPARHGPDEHRRAADRLRPAEDGLEVAAEPASPEGVDEPRLRRAREEREAEAEQDRGERPACQRRADLPHGEVEERRHEQGAGSEQVREPPAADVGDDAGRDLEEDLSDGEERVRRERLRVGEARVEEEQRVHAPDERRGERRHEREDEVDALDVARGAVRGRATAAQRPGVPRRR